MVGFEKALGAGNVMKDQIQYRSQSLLNLARGYFNLVFGRTFQTLSKYKRCEGHTGMRFWKVFIHVIKHSIFM